MSRHFKAVLIGGPQDGAIYALPDFQLVFDLYSPRFPPGGWEKPDEKIKIVRHRYYLMENERFYYEGETE